MKLLALLLGSAAAQIQDASMAPLLQHSKSVRSRSLAPVNTSQISAWRLDHGQEGSHAKMGGFALPVPVSINSDEHGVWEGNNWRYVFKATDEVTKGMYLAFDSFFLPEGSALFMYSETGAIAGAFTSANNNKNNEFMIRPITGSMITLEYNGLTAVEKPSLSIDIVGQAYAAFPGYDRSSLEKGPSGWCNVNSACAEADDWRNEIDAGTIMMSSFGGGYCSGSMINNYEGKQLLLTAFHCRPGSRDVVGFNFAEATCNGNNNNINADTVQGLTSIASGSGSDYHLMEVDSSIPSSYGVYLAGWNSQDTSSWSSPITCISHPSADRQKFTQHYGSITRSGYISNNGNSHWYVKTWELGTTEGGSSGSPLYNSDKQIVGQLHGGYASCNYNYDDYYGALAVSWSDSSLVNALSGSSSVQQMSGARL